MTRSRIVGTLAAACAAFVVTAGGSAQETTPAAGIWEGVWVADADLGPRLDGPVTLHRVGNDWVAQVQGVRARVTQSQQQDGTTRWRFAIDDLGHFIGHQAADTGGVTGHWFQPPGIIHNYPTATPVALVPAGDGVLSGTISPLRDVVSLNIPLTPDPEKNTAPGEDRYRTFLRNPQRNLGVWFRIASAIADEQGIAFYNADGQQLAYAKSIEAGQRFTMLIPRTGMTMDFSRRARNDAPGFFPQRTPAPVDTLLRPAVLDDGWQTAAPAASGLDEQALLGMLNDIRAFEPEQLRAPYIHALLIAHRGNLVFESYFHGYHRERTHDSRSAGKSLGSVLLGAAIRTGAIASVDAPVYDFYGGVDAFANPDPRKQRMTLRHLVTMSPGLACDDGDYEGSPGNEDRMQSQSEQPDWYRYTLDLPMRAEPGSADIYCTAGINLLGGAISKATGRSLPRFFHEQLAVPLQMGHYHMNLSPMERGYLGGGIRLRPRDFIKLGQLYLDGGVWNGHRVVSEDWVRESATAQSSINSEGDYGFAWWRRDFRVGDRSIATYQAAGNGGQMLFVVPELELVVMFNAGNYSDGRTRGEFRDRYMQGAILPAAIAAE
ncbi:MAG: serine hydrolase [Pseudomonadota bacterium]